MSILAFIVTASLLMIVCSIVLLSIYFLAVGFLDGWFNPAPHLEDEE